MMLKRKNLPIFFLGLCFLTLATAASVSRRRQSKLDNPQSDKVAEIMKFHVVSKIQLRYAITDVETRIRNKHSEKMEIFFDMFIPKEAFVSNFSMVIKGKTYQAKVEVKEVADQIYRNSSSTSGLLQSHSLPEFTDGKQVIMILS